MDQQLYKLKKEYYGWFYSASVTETEIAEREKIGFTELEIMQEAVERGMPFRNLLTFFERM